MAVFALFPLEQQAVRVLGNTALTYTLSSRVRF